MPHPLHKPQPLIQWWFLNVGLAQCFCLFNTLSNRLPSLILNINLSRERSQICFESKRNDPALDTTSTPGQNYDLQLELQGFSDKEITLLPSLFPVLVDFTSLEPSIAPVCEINACSLNVHKGFCIFWLLSLRYSNWDLQSRSSNVI